MRIEMPTDCAGWGRVEAVDLVAVGQVAGWLTERPRRIWRSPRWSHLGRLRLWKLELNSLMAEGELCLV
jgi:hypothetical protein